MEVIRFDIDAFEASTKHLSIEEIGCYFSLLGHYYWSEKPFPNDLKRIERLANASNKTERLAVEKILKEFFYLDSDVWRHKRADREIARHHKAKAKARQAVLKVVQSP
jgi:uncharacterized protein YdaU (DUF1376 family)